MFTALFWLSPFQGGEDEEEGEHFSEEEASRTAEEPKPAADPPVEEELEVEERDEEVKEVKADEKENLSGERQSGDGQVWEALKWMNEWILLHITSFFYSHFWQHPGLSWCVDTHFLAGNKSLKRSIDRFKASWLKFYSLDWGAAKSHCH